MTNQIHIQVNVSPLLYISYRFFFFIFHIRTYIGNFPRYPYTKHCQNASQIQQPLKLKEYVNEI